MVVRGGKIILLLLVKFYLIQAQSSTNFTLVSLNVLFRHGDRTPTGCRGTEWYPNDPHANETYEPFGFAALTNDGKLREFALGEALRQRYDDLLGKFYSPSFVRARSTDKARTKMSTELVLAGIYPPKNAEIWNNELNWQPIPITSSPGFIDPYLKWKDCPLYREEIAHVKASTLYKEEVSKFEKLMKDLSNLTGKNIKNPRTVFDLYHLFVAQHSAKLKLPKWTEKYFPYGPMLDAALFEYKTHSFNTKLRKFTTGLPLSKVLRNMYLSIDEKKPKLFLFGGHESNLNAILISLKIWKPHVPQYSSAIIFELHKKSSNYYVKVVYYKGIPAEYEVLVIPGCEEYCPLEKFIELNQDILPEHAFETCFGPASNSKLIPENVNPIEWMYEKFSTMFDA